MNYFGKKWGLCVGILGSTVLSQCRSNQFRSHDLCFCGMTSQRMLCREATRWWFTYFKLCHVLHTLRKKRDLEHETLMDSNHANLSTVKIHILYLGYQNSKLILATFDSNIKSSFPTVWKIVDFSATQNFREINFWVSEVWKMPFWQFFRIWLFFLVEF